MKRKPLKQEKNDEIQDPAVRKQILEVFNAQMGAARAALQAAGNIAKDDKRTNKPM